MHTIALEEHHATQALLAAQAKNRCSVSRPTLEAQLCDLDTGRIATMDAAAIDLQVLSLMGDYQIQRAGCEISGHKHGPLVQDAPVACSTPTLAFYDRTDHFG